MYVAKFCLDSVLYIVSGPFDPAVEGKGTPRCSGMQITFIRGFYNESFVWCYTVISLGLLLPHLVFLYG
jgi:hypothetical protein